MARNSHPSADATAIVYSTPFCLQGAADELLVLASPSPPQLPWAFGVFCSPLPTATTASEQPPRSRSRILLAASTNIIISRCCKKCCAPSATTSLRKSPNAAISSASPRASSSASAHHSHCARAVVCGHTAQPTRGAVGLHATQIQHGIQPNCEIGSPRFLRGGWKHGLPPWMLVRFPVTDVAAQVPQASPGLYDPHCVRTGAAKFPSRSHVSSPSSSNRIRDNSIIDISRARHASE